MDSFIGKSPVVFFGVVEDRTDPLKANRVRIRVYYWNTADKSVLPTSSLKWANVILPTTSAGTSGIGASLHGLVEGSWITGIFLDGEQGQWPIVIGSLAGIPTENNDSSVGYNDPNGIYPKFINEPDVNRLARNENQTLTASKNESRSTGISIANSTETWDEPESTYNAVYPFNKVTETESGHIFEVDDTAGASRIHQYHKSGTFHEIDDVGNSITRIIGADYEVVVLDKNVYIKGKCNVTIDGNVTTHIKGNWNVQVDGNKTETVTGVYNQVVTGKGTANWNGSGSDIVVNNGTSNIGLTTHTHTDPAGIAGAESSTAND